MIRGDGARRLDHEGGLDDPASDGKKRGDARRRTADSEVNEKADNRRPYDLPEESRLRVFPRPEDEVVPVLKSVNQFRQVLRRYLKIGVHRKDCPAASSRKAGKSRSMLAGGAGKPYAAKPGARGSALAEALPGGVGTGIVNCDDLAAAMETANDGVEPAEHIVHDKRFVTHRENDREFNRFSFGHRGAPR